MPIIKHPDQRVGIFIDVQNLYHSAKNIYHARVNFKEVLKEVVGLRKLIRAIAYVVRTETGEEQSFFEALTKIGIEVKMKDLQVFVGGMKKGDWDVGMAVDAIKAGDRLDAVVILSGDGDFVPLVEYLKFTKGVQVEVGGFGKSSSSRLKEAADHFLDLGERRFLIGARR